MKSKVKDSELELIARRLKKEEAEMKKKGTKYLTEKQAVAKYNL